MRWLASILLLCSTGIVSSPAQAALQACPVFSFPLSPVFNPATSWNGTDSGVVINGFLDLGTSYNIAHGVDLSSNNTPDFDMLARCGGKFAFLRLDNKFKAYKSGLEAKGFKTFPYFYLAMPRPLRAASLYTKLDYKDGAAIGERMNTFKRIGESQAAQLEHSLLQGGEHGIPNVTFAGMSGQILAIDVEEKILDENNSTSLARVYFGRFYARAVCSFIAKAKQLYPGFQPVIYTTPSTFGDYLNYAYPQDDACLHGLPVWLARTTPDGGDVIRSSHQVLDLYAQRLCIQSAGNRCVVHQYSHRALLGSLPPLTQKAGPHFDVDRLFPTRIVKDGLNQQFVRASGKF